MYLVLANSEKKIYVFVLMCLFELRAGGGECCEPFTFSPALLHASWKPRWGKPVSLSHRMEEMLPKGTLNKQGNKLSH